MEPSAAPEIGDLFGGLHGSLFPDEADGFARPAAHAAAAAPTNYTFVQEPPQQPVIWARPDAAPARSSAGPASLAGEPKGAYQPAPAAAYTPPPVYSFAPTSAAPPSPVRRRRRIEAPQPPPQQLHPKQRLPAESGGQQAALGVTRSMPNLSGSFARGPPPPGSERAYALAAGGMHLFTLAHGGHPASLAAQGPPQPLPLHSTSAHAHAAQAQAQAHAHAQAQHAQAQAHAQAHAHAHAQAQAHAQAHAHAQAQAQAHAQAQAQAQQGHGLGLMRPPHVLGMRPPSTVSPAALTTGAYPLQASFSSPALYGSLHDPDISQVQATISRLDEPTRLSFMNSFYWLSQSAVPPRSPPASLLPDSAPPLPEAHRPPPSPRDAAGADDGGGGPSEHPGVLHLIYQQAPGLAPHAVLADASRRQDLSAAAAPGGSPAGQAERKHKRGFSEAQTGVMNAHFAAKSAVGGSFSSAEIGAIAAEVGLTETQVRVYFQNRRARTRDKATRGPSGAPSKPRGQRRASTADEKKGRTRRTPGDESGEGGAGLSQGQGQGQGLASTSNMSVASSLSMASMASGASSGADDFADDVHEPTLTEC